MYRGQSPVRGARSSRVDAEASYRPRQSGRLSLICANQNESPSRRLDYLPRTSIIPGGLAMDQHRVVSGAEDARSTGRDRVRLMFTVFGALTSGALAAAVLSSAPPAHATCLSVNGIGN